MQAYKCVMKRVKATIWSIETRDGFIYYFIIFLISSDFFDILKILKSFIILTIRINRSILGSLASRKSLVCDVSPPLDGEPIFLCTESLFSYGNLSKI